MKFFIPFLFLKRLQPDRWYYVTKIISLEADQTPIYLTPLKTNVTALIPQRLTVVAEGCLTILGMPKPAWLSDGMHTEQSNKKFHILYFILTFAGSIVGR